VKKFIGVMLAVFLLFSPSFTKDKKATKITFDEKAAWTYIRDMSTDEMRGRQIPSSRSGAWNLLEMMEHTSRILRSNTGTLQRESNLRLSLRERGAIFITEIAGESRDIPVQVTSRRKSSLPDTESMPRKKSMMIMRESM